MAHLGGTPPQDQLSSGSTSNTNADVVDTLQLPSQPSNRRGSREMIAGRVPVIVESAGTNEEGDVGLEEEVSSFVDFVLGVSNFSGQFCYAICTFLKINTIYTVAKIFKHIVERLLLLFYVFAVVRPLFNEFPFLGLTVTEVDSFRGMFNL